MPRFLMVRGRAGVLVPNPHASAGTSPRFAGMKFNPNAPPGALVTLFEPVDEVLIDSPDLRSAIKNGELTLIRETVADDHDAARAIFAPPARTARPAPEVK